MQRKYDESQAAKNDIERKYTILQGQIDQKIDEEVLRIKKNLEYEAQNFKNEESFKSHQRSVKMEEKIKEELEFTDDPNDSFEFSESSFSESLVFFGSLGE